LNQRLQIFENQANRGCDLPRSLLAGRPTKLRRVGLAKNTGEVDGTGKRGFNTPPPAQPPSDHDLVQQTQRHHENSNRQRRPSADAFWTRSRGKPTQERNRVWSGWACDHGFRMMATAAPKISAERGDRRVGADTDKQLREAGSESQGGKADCQNAKEPSAKWSERANHQRRETALAKAAGSSGQMGLRSGEPDCGKGCRWRRPSLATA